MELKIKQAHIRAANKIRRAKNGTCAYDICEICPTAQALIDLGYENVYVGVISAHATGYRWDIPPASYNWIMGWTAGDRGYPITLVLEEKE